MFTTTQINWDFIRVYSILWFTSLALNGVGENRHTLFLGWYWAAACSAWLPVTGCKVLPKVCAFQYWLISQVDWIGSGYMTFQHKRVNPETSEIVKIMSLEHSLNLGEKYIFSSTRLVNIQWFHKTTGWSRHIMWHIFSSNLGNSFDISLFVII